MIHNRNELPKGKKLPEIYNGKKPVHVAHAVVDEAHTEAHWKVLMHDSSYEVMPASALLDEEKAKAAK